MKADTFAKLVLLETLVDAEIGQFLERHPEPLDVLRETLIARVSDLVEEIDALDAVAAARVYDAVVDFLAELSDDPAATVEATLRFKRAMTKIFKRGMTHRDQEEPSNWAVALDELLAKLTDEYHHAVRPGGVVMPREYGRVQVLLARAREVADRMLWSAGVRDRAELHEQIDRLTFAVRHQRLQPTEVDRMIRPAQKGVRIYRPSTLTRIGAFVLSQLVGRSKDGSRSTRTKSTHRRRRSDESPAPA